jgi:hypothetical protein
MYFHFMKNPTYFLLLMLFLVSCQKDDEQVYCTQQFEPVCGSNGVTYGNACLAEAAGITSYTTGECN